MRTTRDLAVALSSLLSEMNETIGDDGATLRLDRWAPGDGKTRYRLVYRASDGLERECGVYHMGPGTTYETLRTMEALFYAIRSNRKRLAAA